MENGNWTISLEEFLGYLIKKWKLSALLVVLAASVFAVAALIFGEEITVPHSEEYLYYEQEVAWHEDYLENSILMNLDPASIYQRTVFLRNVEDRELLKDYVTSSEIWEGFETDRSKKYMFELLEWKETESGTVEVLMRHATSEECLTAVEYLNQKISERDTNVEITIGAEAVVVDEALQDEHLRWYDRIDYANSLLLDSQAGYTIRVNPVIAAITGALAGGILAVVLEIAAFMMKRNREQNKQG